MCVGVILWFVYVSHGLECPYNRIEQCILCELERVHVQVIFFKTNFKDSLLDFESFITSSVFSITISADQFQGPSGLGIKLIVDISVSLDT